MALTSRHSPDAAPHDDSTAASTPAEPGAPVETPAPAGAAAPVQAEAQAGLAQLGALRALVPIVAGFIAAPSIVWWIGQAAAFLKDPGGYDFCIYFAAALALRDNPHANVFDLHVIQAAAQAHHAVVPLAPYLYPPLLAIALGPLTRLPYIQAARIWAELNLAFWVLATIVLARVLTQALPAAPATPPGQTSVQLSPPARGRPRWLPGAWRRPSDMAILASGLAVFASMSHEPTGKGVALGQVSTLIYLLLVLVPWLLRRRMPELAGVALALATVIKVYPIVLLGYFLLRGRWRLVAGALACFLLAFVVMARAVGIQGVLASRNILSVAGQHGLAANNQSLAHVPIWIAAELGRDPGPKTMESGYVLIASVTAVFALGMLTMMWRGLRTRHAPLPGLQAGGPLELVGYAWAICTMLLISPIVWEHYGSWLLPAFALCLGFAVRVLAQPREGRGGQSGVAPAMFAAIAVIVAYALTSRLFPFGYDAEGSLSPGPYVMHLALRPLFMVLRPLGTTLAWLAAGWLFLRPQLAFSQARLTRAARTTARLPTPSAASPGEETPRQRGWRQPEPGSGAAPSPG
jgi:Glycosyltransferase family 87